MTPGLRPWRDDDAAILKPWWSHLASPHVALRSRLARRRDAALAAFVGELAAVRLASAGGEVAASSGIVTHAGPAGSTSSPGSVGGAGEVRGEVAGFLSGDVVADRRLVNARRATDAAAFVLPLGVVSTAVFSVVDAGSALLETLLEAVVAAMVATVLSLACSLLVWLVSKWRSRTGREAWAVEDAWAAEDGADVGALHDREDVEYLGEEDRQALAAGELPLPRPVQALHPGVLVTIDSGRDGVVWVDRGVADVVRSCALLEVDVVESCEGGAAAVDEGDDGRATLWFGGAHDLRRFLHMSGAVAAVPQPVASWAASGGSSRRGRERSTRRTVAAAGWSWGRDAGVDPEEPAWMRGLAWVQWVSSPSWVVRIPREALPDVEHRLRAARTMADVLDSAGLRWQRGTSRVMAHAYEAQALLGDPVRTVVARLAGRALTGCTIARADRAAWAAARTLPDLCRLTVGWLQGQRSTQPGYYGGVDVDEDLAPGLTQALIACNHAGFLTRSSQAGYTRPGRQGGQARRDGQAGLSQLAAVEGLASTATAQALQERLAGTPYRVRVRSRHRIGHQRQPGVVVTRAGGRPVTQFGGPLSRRELASTLRGCDRRAIAAAAAAARLVIWDPRPGHNSLWADLQGFAADLITEEHR